jgi:hypothetical protein
MRRFKRYSIDEYMQYLDSFNWERIIKEIHVHHTWKPSIKDFNGEKTIWAMWNYHVNIRGWSDIGQHASVDPEGYIWDGRDLNISPASISGRNGSPYSPFMFEMIGNFDKGNDKLEGKQLDTTLKLCSFLLSKFNLSKDKIKFHREFAPKSCPGTGIDKEWFVDGVLQYNKIKEAIELFSKYFQDNVPQWVAPHADSLKEKGILKGKHVEGKTILDGDKEITRNEAVVLMSRAIDYILEKNNK